jgi:hypothetical protein
MKDKLVNLLIRIDKMESHTEIKEEIGKLIIELDNNNNENENIEIKIEGTRHCLPCVCASHSNCGDCNADINTDLNMPEKCIIM